MMREAFSRVATEFLGARQQALASGLARAPSRGSQKGDGTRRCSQLADSPINRSPRLSAGGASRSSARAADRPNRRRRRRNRRRCRARPSSPHRPRQSPAPMTAYGEGGPRDPRARATVRQRWNCRLRWRMKMLAGRFRLGPIRMSSPGRSTRTAVSTRRSLSKETRGSSRARFQTTDSTALLQRTVTADTPIRSSAKPTNCRARQEFRPPQSFAGRRRSLASSSPRNHTLRLSIAGSSVVRDSSINGAFRCTSKASSSAYTS